MEYLIFILSHNSKSRTSYVYETLAKQTDSVYVLENSYIQDRKFTNSKTIDFGEKNIGIGGFYDFVCNYAKDKNDLFIGIFNNDISEISDDFVKRMSKHFKKENGIVHPALNDFGCPYPQMKVNGDSFRYVNMIENVVPFYNVEVLKELSKYMPLHYYGWVDILASRLSQKVLHLNNVLIDDIVVKHERSGVRKELEPIDSNWSQYQINAERTWREWVNKYNFPESYWTEGIFDIHGTKQ